MKVILYISQESGDYEILNTTEHTPLADVQAPRCHNPQRHAEDHQHRAGVRRHQRFPHEAGVEVYLEITYGTRHFNSRGLCTQPDYLGEPLSDYDSVIQGR